MYTNEGDVGESAFKILTENEMQEPVRTGRSNARARRIKYELSKRFCREIFNASVENVPFLQRRRAAAVLLQSQWREFRLKQALQKARKEELERQRSVAAALMIQARVRVYLKYCRAKLAEAELREISSTTIAAAIRRMLSIKEVKSLRQQRLIELQNASVVTIQCIIRAKLSRSRAKRKRNSAGSRFFARAFALQKAHKQDVCATVIQRFLLGFVQRRKLARLRRSVICGQKFVRGVLARKAIRNELTSNSLLAEKQGCAEQVKEDLDVIQDRIDEDESQYSGSVASEESLESYSFNDESSQSLSREDGARVIQSWFREINTNAAALVITRFARQCIDMKTARLHLEKLKQKSLAATTIQCCMRSIGAKLKVRVAS